MSGQYSTSVKVQYLQPRTHLNNTLTEFRLDQDTAYFPNLRLSNIGLTASADKKHNELTGAYGCIKNIRLMDGSVEISATRHANRWLSFMSQRDHNQNNLCVHSKLSKARVGYMLDDNDKCNYVFTDVNDVIATTDGAGDVDNKLALLDLRKVFPILQNLTILDTSLMKNLKVVIEWTIDPTVVATLKDIAGVKIKEPELLCDQVMAEGAINSLRKSQKSVVWDEIEHDQYNIPAIANPAGGAGDKVVQPTSAVVNGFDNKYISRMLLMKVPAVKTDIYSGDVSQGLGNFASVNLFREKLQLRVNGANIFAGDGIRSDSQKAMLMSQSWGDLNILPFSNRQNVGSEDRDAVIQNSSGVPPLNASKMDERIGHSDYIGFSVEDKIRQLNFQHERTGLNNTLTIRQNELAYDIHIFAECRKVLQIGNGGYKIAYM